jgi:hypothetical protein
MWNHKIGYNWYSRVAQGLFRCPGQNLACGPCNSINSNTTIRWLQGILLGKISNFEFPEMAKSWILEACWQLYMYISMYISLQFFIWCPGQIVPSTLLDGFIYNSTRSYDYLWQRSFIITCLRERRNSFILANERWLGRDTPLEEFQGHAPTCTENFGK